MEKVKLGDQIGYDGHYRDCHEVVGDPTLCAKVIRARRYAKLQKWLLKHGVSKKLVGPQLPMFIFSWWRFGHTDLNRFEIEKINELHPDFKEYIVPEAHMAEAEDGREVMVTKRVMNYDGTPSLTMKEIGVIQNEAFWEHLEKFVGLMKEHRQFFLTGPMNIAVQKISPTEWRPVCIDVKRLNWSGDTVRTWFAPMSKKAQEEKVDSRYDRLIRTFRDGEESSWSSEVSESPNANLAPA